MFVFRATCRSSVPSQKLSARFPGHDLGGSFSFQPISAGHGNVNQSKWRIREHSTLVVLQPDWATEELDRHSHAFLLYNSYEAVAAVCMCVCVCDNRAT